MTKANTEHTSSALSTPRTRRDAIRFLAASAAGSPFLSSLSASAQTGTVASQSGMTATALFGDGVTDDGPALQQFIDEAAESNLPLTIPPGNYAVYQTIEARTGLHLEAYGATLVTYIEDLGMQGTAPTFRIHDVTDVQIYGLQIDGRKDFFRHTQWKHGFSLQNTERILIQNCVVINCKGDGIILDDTVVGTINEDIQIVSSMFHRSYRNGGTASGARNVEFRDCVFSATYGTKPMAGFDIEPDRGDVICTDVRFVRCKFIGNGDHATGDGAGFDVSFFRDAESPQNNVQVVDCLMSGNAGAGIDLYRDPNGVQFTNCDVSNNALWGVRVFDQGSDLVFIGGRVHENGDHGIFVYPPSGSGVNGIVLRELTISHNGSGDEVIDGVHLLNDVSDVLITDSIVEGAPRYGIYASDTVTDVRVENTEFRDNGAGDIFPDTLGIP